MTQASANAESIGAPSAGDQAVHELLIRRHHGLVRAACRRQVPASEVDDCVQAVFLVLLRRSAQAARSPSLEAWLLMVVRHVCATARRTLRNRRRAEQGAALQSAHDGQPLPALVVDLLDECLAGLPKRQRDTITLHYLAGKSRDEVAAELGIGIEAVHKQCQRGLERLRELLRQRGATASLAVLLAVFADEAQAASAIPPAAAAVIGMRTSGGTVSPATHYASGAHTTMIMSSLIPALLVAVAALLIASGATYIVSAADPAPTILPSPTGSPSDVASLPGSAVIGTGLPAGWWTEAGPDAALVRKETASAQPTKADPHAPATRDADAHMEMRPWQRAAEDSLIGSWDVRDVSDQAAVAAKAWSRGEPARLDIPAEPRDIPDTILVITEESILVQEAGKRRMLFDSWFPAYRNADLLYFAYVASMKSLPIDPHGAMEGQAAIGGPTVDIPQYGTTQMHRLGDGFVLADGSRYLWAWRRHAGAESP